MPAPHQDTAPVFKSEVTPTENGGLVLVGSFRVPLVFENIVDGLDQIEAQIERAGQEFKRQTTPAALEAADARCSQLFQQTQPHLIKNGKPPFTIVAQYGEVKFKRQRLVNTQTGKTLTPSAILWQTSKRHHITSATRKAACDASQEVSYRKAAKQLAEKAGTEQLISTSTVWNKKQDKGKELEQNQNDFVQQVRSGKEVTLPAGVPSNSTRCIEEGKIQIQMDEVKTKSQEKDKKWNLTYTATIETADKECYYLAGKSVEQLSMVLMAYLMMLGYLDKSLEVVSDGATWISDWVSSVTQVPVVQILCWFHLQKRIYEGLSAVGWAKEQRELLEREILGLLWKGKTAQVVWILWGLRSKSRVPKRIDELMGYLLRKRRLIVDYEARRGERQWLASTRVEGWNDTAVADRCKHRGASWTASGVLAVALYQSQKIHTNS
jgi:hypothetical protein